MPLEKDNDLIYLNDSLTRAIGKITYLTGRILTSDGPPIKGALVEIWHADNGGKYVYQKNDPGSTYDTNFQGFGQCLTGEGGYYKFRTIKAGLYNGRTRHFHLAVAIPAGVPDIARNFSARPGGLQNPIHKWLSGWRALFCGFAISL